ncbi:hypothetical protein DH2020_023282 [Rehmannia glutinosa]|uniref:Flavin-containing monooxygenase n=1 Tax=Rehmannia glutinosa TaxID=99300 RepID=A0ABR0W9E3_REHGL
MAPLLKVAVIGAGISGLTTAHALKGEGHQVVVYEKSDQLGGTWAYNPQVESDPLGLDPNRDIVHSSLYHSLCTNLPRQLMGLLDYPFASRKYDDSRTFPHHKEVLEFLNEFAGDFGLLELIRFNTEVVRVEQVDLRSDQWIVGSKTNKLTSDEIFDAVVVCIGHHTQPRLADIPGIEKWPGKQMHSHNYRVPEPFKDEAPLTMMIDLQAKWMAHVLSGKAPLPSEEEMLADVQKYYRYMDDKGISKHHTHSLWFEILMIFAVRAAARVECGLGRWNHNQGIGSSKKPFAGQSRKTPTIHKRWKSNFNGKENKVKSQSVPFAISRDIHPVHAGARQENV